MDNDYIHQRLLIQRDIEEARRRFRLHVVWATACAASAVLGLFVGVVWGAVEVLK